jgi:hypothetical protein
MLIPLVSKKVREKYRMLLSIRLEEKRQSESTLQISTVVFQIAPICFDNITLYSTMVSIYHLTKHYKTQCIYLFLTLLRINSEYFLQTSFIPRNRD